MRVSWIEKKRKRPKGGVSVRTQEERTNRCTHASPSVLFIPRKSTIAFSSGTVHVNRSQGWPLRPSTHILCTKSPKRFRYAESLDGPPVVDGLEPSPSFSDEAAAGLKSRSPVSVIGPSDRDRRPFEVTFEATPVL